MCNLLFELSWQILSWMLLTHVLLRVSVQVEQAEESVSAVQERWVRVKSGKNVENISCKIQYGAREKFLNLQVDNFCHFSFRHYHSQCEIKDWIRPVSGDCSESWTFRFAHKSQRFGDSHRAHRAELSVSSCEFPDHTTLTAPKIHLQNPLRGNARAERFALIFLAEYSGIFIYKNII